MSNDINELDVNEEGLQGIFGDRFQDLSKGEKKEKVTVAAQEKKAVQKPSCKARDTKWEPVEEVTFLTRLKEVTKRVVSFGVLNLLVFYWQQKGLMAESIALPCMIFCAVMAGWGAARLGVDR